MASNLSVPELVSAGAIFPVLTIAFTGLRVYSRRLQNLKLGVDDWLIFPAALLTIAIGILLLFGVGIHALGYPTPKYKVSPDPYDFDVPYTVQTGQLATYLSFIFQVLALGLIKLSVIAFYRRIFVVDKSRRTPFNIISWVVVGIVIAWTIAFFFSWIGACGKYPIAYYSSIPSKYRFCFDTEAMVLGFSTSDLITDLIILALPIPMITRLQTTKKKKLGIAVVFAMGLLAVGMSATRAALFFQILHAEYQGAPPGGVSDHLAITANAHYWLVLETGLTFVAANLPVIYASFVSPKSFITRSIMAMTSLRSRSSDTDRSYGSGYASRPRTINDHTSSASVLASKNRANEIDTERSMAHEEANDDVIHVTSEIKMTSEDSAEARQVARQV